MPWRDLGRTVLLCIVGGAADGISILRYEAFVGAMTGNTVLLGIDLAGWRLDRAGYHAGIVAAFLAAVIATQAALRLRTPRGLPLVLTAVLLGLSELVAGEWSAAVCAAALGMQSAAVREIGGVSISTVFITGNLVRLGSAVPQVAAPQQQTTLTILTTSWVAYAVGAVIGASVLHLIGHPMLVPAALALGAALAELAAR